MSGRTLADTFRRLIAATARDTTVTRAYTGKTLRTLRKLVRIDA